LAMNNYATRNVLKGENIYWWETKW
jgi:hypothetical protein